MRSGTPGASGEIPSSPKTREKKKKKPQQQGVNGALISNERQAWPPTHTQFNSIFQHPLRGAQAFPSSVGTPGEGWEKGGGRARYKGLKERARNMFPNTARRSPAQLAAGSTRAAGRRKPSPILPFLHLTSSRGGDRNETSPGPPTLRPTLFSIGRRRRGRRRRWQSPNAPW